MTRTRLPARALLLLGLALATPAALCAQQPDSSKRAQQPDTSKPALQPDTSKAALQPDTSRPAMPAGETVDRIIAVVGDSVITALNIDEDMVRLQAQGQLPQNPSPDQIDAIRKQLLDSRVNDLILLQAAQRDTSLKVSPEEVTNRAQSQISDMQRNFPTADAFARALQQQGLTLAEYRQQVEGDARKAMLVQAYLDKVQRDRKAPAPTEDQIRKYFEEQRAQLGERPATITFRQIVVAAQASDSAKAAARAKADSILTKIRNGEDFAGLAKHYSDDVSNRDQGGDLGFFRRGQMVQAFEDAAFTLAPGQVSGLVESPFGYHIIKVEKVRGAERQARHILIRPVVTGADTLRAIDRAKDVIAKLKDGTESFDSLVAHYNDPSEQQTKVGPYPRNRLPAPYDTQLADAKVGQILGPIRLAGETPAKWAVVKVDEVKPAGQYSLDDPELRQQIREQVQRQLLIDEIIGDLKRGTYVDIRLPG